MPPLGDDVLVRRAARSVALQATALVALAMLVLVALVTAVVVHQQAQASDQLLSTTLATADDVGDPPPGAWLVITRGARVSATAGLPEVLGPRLDHLRAVATRRIEVTSLVGTAGRRYRVVTQLRRAGITQVVLDLSAEHRQRTELLEALGVATALALAFAAVTGALLGRRAVGPLADALALQRAFVADASHELRAPLTLLSTRAQVLDQAIQVSALDQRSRTDSAGVVHDIGRLAEVVDDLLTAADPGSRGEQHLTDLGALVDAVVDSAGAHAEAVDVQLGCQVAAQAWVLGSPPALRRAVLSLVDNAIEHTPAAGRVDVTVVAGRTVTLTVRDTGPGIAAEPGHDIFARFASGGGRAGRAHYGLGLALSNDVANRHGGHLRSIDSAVGAAFEMVLPAARAARPHEPRRARGRSSHLLRILQEATTRIMTNPLDRRGDPP